MGIVHCKVPRLGLGNQLFPIMKAYLFADINNLRIVVTGYNQFKVGPYLRRDKSKRNYNGYFVFQQGILQEQLDRIALLKYRSYQQEDEHVIEKVSNERNALYTFNNIPSWADYFNGLRDYREQVITLFWKILLPGIKLLVDQQEAPCIGMHIRMGDYRKLKEGEDFSKVGTVRTPEDYFIDTIKSIRSVANRDLPVSVFTDGRKHEFENLFSVGNIKIVEGNQDIVDLLLLSKSRIIVTSAGSTFSAWAGFLSDAALVMHPHHIHQPIRPINSGFYEGRFDPDNALLVNSIRSAASGKMTADS